MLDLVQHDQGAGEFPLGADRLLDLGDHFLDRDLALLGELFLQKNLDFTRISGESGWRSQDGLGHRVGDIEVGDLQVEVATGFLKVVPNRLFQSLVAEPHHEVGTGVLLGKPHRLEDDAEKFQTHTLPSSRAECARRSMKPARSLGNGG